MVYGDSGGQPLDGGRLISDVVPPPKGIDFIIPKAVTGDLRVLVLMIEFSNFNSITSYTNVYNKVVDVDNYIQEVSYGNARLVIYQLGTWITLNRTREYYGADSGGQIDVNFLDFISDSLLAADPYIDYNTVDYVFLVHAGNDQASSGDPNDLWSRASLGKWFFSLDGGVYLGWMILAETDPYGVFAHEFGHNIGLKDLYDYNGQVIYVGRWSLMASGSWLQPPSSVMAVEKNWMGWLSSSQISTINQDQYRLLNVTPLENSGPLLMVKIPVSTVYYTVEYRRTIKTDAALPGSGVIIAWVDESLSSGSGPVRVVDKNPFTTSKNDAYFVDGDVYVNIVDDFYVKVVSLTQSYAMVFVQKGIPNLRVSDISYVSSNQNYNFTVKISNLGGPNPNPFRVALYLDGSLVGEKTFSGTINRNGVAQIVFNNVFLSSGSHTVEVFVDSRDDVIESNEGDNRKSISVVSKQNYILTSYVAFPGDRVDIGTNVTLHMFFALSDGVTPFANGVVNVNNTSYVTNSSGWISVNVYRDTVGRVEFQVTDPSGSQTVVPTVIFDRVSIILNVSKDWINIGENASISINAFYEYDGTPFSGMVALNQSTVQNVPGRYVYGVSSISDQLYGLTVYRVTPVAVVFDAIEVVFTVGDNRIDVGSTANISFIARYAYSKAPYPGVLTLNDTLTKDVVGLYWYGVILVSPDPNNITALYYEPVYIIFDRVVVEVRVDNRVDVGSDALEGVDAYYEFDGQPFIGEIFFNDSTVKNQVGIYRYSVTSIRDDLYGLTVFKADVITVIYDMVVINLYPLRERYDLGMPIEIGIDAYYAYDGSPFDGIVYLNGSLIQNISGSYLYTVVAVSNDSYGITVFEANSVRVVVDRVIIQLSVLDDRIDVGDSADISWTAYYEFDGRPFEGYVYLNDSLSKEVVGRYSYTVANISDPLYGLTAYSSNVVEVIFDRVVVILSTNDSRIDVGSKARIEIFAFYEFDGLPFNGDVILNNPLVYDEVGLVEYRVERIIDNGPDGYGLTVFTSNSVEIIFDMVIIELTVLDDRIDIGSQAILNYTAYYAYDGMPFIGNISLNDSLTKDMVGRYIYSVSEISDPLYGLSMFESNEVIVIFYRVVIQLAISDDRIDVGSKAEISINAYYEYDGTIFMGDIVLNDSLRKDEVGLYFYTVSSINDAKYGLTVFESNVVSVIFDRVVIILDVTNPVVPLGLEAPIDADGYYEYDMQPLVGKIYLNDSTYKSDPGRYVYTVSSIDDNLYQLTVFVSNTVEVIFERPVLKVYIEATSPFDTQVKIGIYLKSNDSLINGLVWVNGIPVEDRDQDGYLTASIPAFLPIQNIDIEAYVGNYSISDRKVSFRDPISESLGLNVNEALEPYLGESGYIHPLMLIIYLITALAAFVIILLWRRGLIF